MIAERKKGEAVSTDVPPSRAMLGTPEVVISPENNAELNKLYRMLPYAVIAARAALKVAGEQPAPTADQRFRELDQHVEAIIASINKILG
jgi:hypothetical protein